MNKSDVLKKLIDGGIIPVVRVQSAQDALKVAAALEAGDLPCIEITMTVPGAVGVIRDLVKSMGSDIIIGAGTVINAEQAAEAIEAGAEYIVSPSLDLETIKACRTKGKVSIPGALTPTEVLTAWNAGADMVKVFPAGNVGGASYIKALKAPLPQIKLVPTGGVNLQTAADFIKAGASALGVGTALVDKKAVAEGKYEIITERARQFIKIIKEARGA